MHQATSLGTRRTVGRVATIALLAALAAPVLRDNYRFAGFVRAMDHQGFEDLVVDVAYPGLPAVLELLAAHPDQRVFGFVDAGPVLTKIDAELGFTTRLIEAMYPRRLLRFDPAAIAAGDLVVAAEGRQLEVDHVELLRIGHYRVLEVRR